MNGTRWAIRPTTNATSRESRSSSRDYHGALAGLACCQRCAELGSTVEGIGSLAGLDLGELGDERVALSLGEAGNGGPLRFYPEAGFALPGGRDAVVGDGMLHGDKNPPLQYRQPPPFDDCTYRKYLTCMR
jgi:hypothetical protein